MSKEKEWDLVQYEVRWLLGEREQRWVTPLLLDAEMAVEELNTMGPKYNPSIIRVERLID